MSSQIKYICSFGIWFAAIQMAGNVADGEQCGTTCAGPGDYVVQGNWIFIIRQPSSAGIFITPGALGTLHHHVNIYQLFFLHGQFDQNRLSGFISFLHARWFQDMLIIQILSFFKISYLIIITEFWIPSIFMLLFLFFVQHVMLDGFQI